MANKLNRKATTAAASTSNSSNNDSDNNNNCQSERQSWCLNDGKTVGKKRTYQNVHNETKSDVQQAIRMIQFRLSNVIKSWQPQNMQVVVEDGWKNGAK